MKALMRTNVSGFGRQEGKVRDIYNLGARLAIVATDRISAFDVVMPNGIPDKGKILTALTKFWLEYFDVTMFPHHLVSTRLEEFPKSFQNPEFEGRTMLCKKAERVLPVECIVRGYLSGSGWKDYRRTGRICGIELPSDLKESQQIPDGPIFTLSTKAVGGAHDENIGFEAVCAEIGEELAQEVKKRSLKIYEAACRIAAERGIIIADTKFEFGVQGKDVILIDEVLTPDSSRFWPADKYEPGRSQESFDKQFVRDWLEDQGWDKKPPAPELPDNIVRQTRQKYIEIFERLTGQKFQA